MNDQDGVPDTVEGEDDDGVKGEADGKEEEENAEDDGEEGDDDEMEEEESDTHAECGKEQFFYFVFEAKKFLDSETKTKVEESVNEEIRQLNKDHAVDVR